jgi:nucleotide-binding universal stress UspA family protein
VLLASRLTQLTGASVSVAFPYHPLFATVPSAVAEQRARDELCAMLPGDPIPSQARFLWSNSSWPIHALHELAAFEQADLIVFGAAPERLGRRCIELMERMVHGAPCAVAVAPDRYAESAPPAIRRVAAGFNDTAEGRAAVLTASELARLAGQPLTVVSGAGLTGALAAYAAMSPALPEAERKMYEEALACARRIAGEVGGGASIDVRRGDPADVLLEASAATDLLVVGSRAYGPVRHTLLGGVSAAVMREASCPVLVLPRQALRDETALVGEPALAER